MASKRLIAPLVLASFLAMAFFSFSAMTYGADGQMQDGCPFSLTGASLCPPSALPGTIHHLSALQSLLNVPVSLFMTVLVNTLFAVAATLAFAYTLLSLELGPPQPVRVRATPSALTSRKKLTRWLSLFENSPSVL